MGSVEASRLAESGAGAIASGGSAQNAAMISAMNNV